MKKILILFLFVGKLALATDVVWIQMYVNHSYVDVSTDCRAIKPGGSLLLSAEVNAGKASRILISNYPYVWPFQPIYRSIELTPAELSKVSFYQDAKGRFWLKRISLPSRLLKWVLYHSSRTSSYCELPQTLSTTSPELLRYEFETEGIDEGILISYSQKTALSGLRSDGYPYEATLQFSQREYKTNGEF